MLTVVDGASSTGQRSNSISVGSCCCVVVDTLTQITPAPCSLGRGQVNTSTRQQKSAGASLELANSVLMPS
jgi:hypothetical protein